MGIGAGMVLARWLLPVSKKTETESDEIPVLDPMPETKFFFQEDGETPALQKLARENEELKLEYKRLLARTKESEQNVQDEERAALFRALETILIQLPVLSERIKAGTDIPFDTVLSLVDMIPEKLETLEIRMINTPGQITYFDPVRHKPVPSQTGQVSAQTPVKVIAPGFQYKDIVLTPSEVRMQTDGK